MLKVPEQTSGNSLLARRDELIESIIELDNKYNDNKIEKEEYKESRLKMKGYIADIDKLTEGIKYLQNDTE